MLKFLIAFSAGRTNSILNKLTPDTSVEKEIKEAHDSALKEFYPNEETREKNRLKFNRSIELIAKSIDSNKPVLLNQEQDQFLSMFYKQLMKKPTAWNYIQSQFFLNQKVSLDTIKQEIENNKEVSKEIQFKLDRLLDIIQKSTTATIESKSSDIVQSGRIRNYKVPSKGRTVQKELVKDFFETRNENFLFVYGSGGMGKTHLLYDVIMELEEEPIYFLGHRNSDLNELFELCYGNVPENISKSQLFRNFLKQFESNSDQLIIDDFYEISDEYLRNVIIELTNVRKGKVVVVSRSLDIKLEKSDSHHEPLKLNKLDEEPFLEYVQEYYENSDYNEKFDLTEDLKKELYKELKGYPLGVKFLFDLYTNVDAKSSIFENLKDFDPTTDSSGKEYMDRLLDSVINHGDPSEMELLKEMSVFTTPFENYIITELPSFKDQATYKSLVRKDFIWESTNDKIELHALVKELLYEKNHNKLELNKIAANYYEDKSNLQESIDIENFKLASFHYSNTDNEIYNNFLDRQDKLFGRSSKIKKLINEKTKDSIERLKYRIELYPTILDAYTELVLILIVLKEYKQADYWIKKGLDLEVTNRYLRLNKGLLHKKQYQFPEAEKWLLKLAQEGHIHARNEIGILYKEWKKFPEAEKWLLKLAQEGHIHARNEIGILYREWKKFPEAEKWLLKLAQEGNILARNEIGILYREWKKFPEAEKWLLKLAQEGDILARNEIGILYREWKKFPEAEKWLLKLAQEGNILARNEIGILYREWKKFPEAGKWLLKLAQEGHIHARNEIGILYREWKKFPEAEKWLLKLAQEGHIHARNEIGILYREWKKFPEAEKWLLKLAQEGNILARNEIGILYREWKKFPEAEKWLLKLAQEGDILARNEIGILYREWKKFPEAEKWLLKLAQEGNILARNEIGILYREWKKFPEAGKWLLKLAQEGHIHARNEIGILYREWKKFPEAEKWLLKAIEQGNMPSENEIGILYREWKKFPEAEKWLLKLAQEGNVMACNELALLYKIWGTDNYIVTNKEKVKSSKEWFLKAIEVKKDNIQSYDGLGKVLILLEEYDEAERYLNLGLDIKKYDWQIQKQLVKLAIYKLRDSKKARSYLNQLKENRKFRDTHGFISKIEQRMKNYK